MELTHVPENIKRLTDGKPYETDDTGMSGSRVMLFGDCVLKIVKSRKENRETIRMMKWLRGKLPVPEVICFEEDEEYQYLLMTRMKGRMACDAEYLEKPEKLVRLLAEALRIVWSVDVSDCPRTRDTDAELREARYRVENGLVDMDNTDPGTFGEGGFRDPEELLEWLENNRPSSYEPVLSHGDFCLPNIFLEDGRISGFIDLGFTGAGDMWRDLALCRRSLMCNLDGTYGGKVYPPFDTDLLFRELGIEPDNKRLRYYALLDELF
ncbi:MAG: aminoglycoside 3'-phosphotransferase [Oscillospiraceae bacterium]|nr:aminoglycoside 3'-phosphotransferase [Oscillospiraceae bacterium]